jgi:hypothetical protein
MLKPIIVGPHPPLTDADAELIFKLAHEGKLDEARLIVESKGLTWLSSMVKKTQILKHKV